MGHSTKTVQAMQNTLCKETKLGGCFKDIRIHDTSMSIATSAYIRPCLLQPLPSNFQIGKLQKNNVYPFADCTHVVKLVPAFLHSKHGRSPCFRSHCGMPKNCCGLVQDLMRFLAERVKGIFFWGLVSCAFSLGSLK